MIDSPTSGLPHHLFEYVSSIVPIVNVDLIAHRPERGIIMSWRDDGYYGPGWHLPGGCLRYKESLISRLHKVAESEIAVKSVLTDVTWIGAYQCMHATRDIRGHFITFVYSAVLENEDIPVYSQSHLNGLRHGDVYFHLRWPDNVISQHERYSRVFNNILNAQRPDIGDANLLEEYGGLNEIWL